MHIDFGLNLTQEQKLVMTQQMQLSIKILQMPTYELREHIEKELLENPVLEVQYKYDKEQNNVNHKELASYLQDYSYDSKNNSVYSDDEVSPFLFITKPKSLKEHLKEQISELPIDKYIRTICNYMVESLNPKGYLDIELDELINEISCSKDILEKSIVILQNLEPAGVGAKDIKECLILQLKRQGINNEDLILMINNNLEDIAENKYALIAKSLNITTKKAQEYGDIIKRLEPKPSRGFYTGDEVKFIIPDAEIKNIQGKYFIIMNEGVLPKLLINSTYTDILNNSNDYNAVAYVKEKMGNAMFLIKSIEQRKSTLYKVLEKILNKQQEYFDKGIRYIKPMTLKEIAEDINMHESTVSRAIREKYILTPVGTIKIKDLFTTGIKAINSSDVINEDIATSTIKILIEEIINGENKNKPLSDQGISEILKDKEINISRRTVAKYREEMGIKASSKRKRF